MIAKKKKVADRILLVDGDIMCYRMVTCKDFLTEVHNADDEWWEMLDMGAAIDELEARISEAMVVAGCGSALMAFGSRDNFRKSMIDATYKSNRAGKKKPLGYYALCDRAAELWQKLAIPTLEADDVLGIYHTDPSLVGNRETVVMSNDKDMRTLPGLLLVPGEEMAVERISDAEALANWMWQTLTGDTSDGYPGCPGIGIVKAKKIVDPEFVCSLVESKGFDVAASAVFNGAVAPAFIDKGLTFDDALRQARLARILRVGDCDPTADTVEVKLWRPISSQKDHSSKAPSKKQSSKMLKDSRYLKMS